MKEQHGRMLHDLLAAIRETGVQIPAPVKAHECHEGWQVIFFQGDQGLSIVCHDGSYELETASIQGSLEDWKIMGDVNAYRTPEEVASDILLLFA